MSQTGYHAVLRGTHVKFLQYLFVYSFFDSIGYVEFRSIDLVEKAMALSGTVVMGLPIMVQLTESERNRLHPGDG